MFVIKRNGSIEEFDKEKIRVAIRKALVETGECEGSQVIALSRLVANDVCEEIDDEYIGIEDIQDLVEFKLMGRGLKNTAKAYILYRAERNRIRNQHPLDKSVLGLINYSNKEVLTENSNKQGQIVSTQRDLIAGEISKYIAKTQMIPQDIVKAHDEGIIHIHDLDYYVQSISNCIEENGWIYIKTDSGIKYIQLKDLDDMFNIENGLNIMKDKVYVLGRNGWTRLKAISKRNANEDMYTFRTRTGLKLKTTKNHKIPVIRDGEEKLLFAENINKKDILLTTTGMKLNPYEFDSKDFINLMELEDEDIQLYITNIKPLKDYIKYKYQKTIFDILEEDEYCLRGLHTYQFKKILERIDLPYELFFKLRIKAKGSKHSFPLILPMNESFAKLYGYIYADGGVYINNEQSTYHLTFTNTNLDLIKDFQKCFKDVFDEEPSIILPSGTSPCYRLCIGSKLIVKIFKDFCEGKFNGSSDISIPNFIMNGSDEIKLAFLSSIIDCDGSLGDEQMTYVSCSKRYSEQIVKILTSLGIHAGISKKDSKGSKYVFKHFNGTRNYDSYIIRISRKSEIYDLYTKMNTFKKNELYDNYETEKSLNFIESKILDIKIKKENTNVYDLQTESGWFVVNDYVVHNCELVPLDKMFEEGTVINKKLIRTPKSLRTASTLATQIATQISSFTYGGQTMSLSHLAPYVRISEKKIREELLEEMDLIHKVLSSDEVDKIVEKRLKKEIKDSVQTFNYQISTMNSTNGQSPFISLCMYLDENPEYKKETAMLIEEFLNQRIEGMENEFGVKSTPTFPKLLFFLDEDNMYPTSEYYYLKQLAIKSTSLRMAPDYISVKKMKEKYGYAFPCINKTCA